MFLRADHGLFFRFIRIFEGIFKESKLVFQGQNPQAGLVHESLRNRALLYQLCQLLAVNAGHHVDIHPGSDGPDRSLFPVRTVAVGDHLLDGGPVRNQNAVKAHLLPEDPPHEPAVSGSRSAVHGIKGSHDHGGSGLHTGLIGSQVKFPEGVLGKLHRIVISSRCGSTIPCKMLHAGCHLTFFPEVVPLETFYHSRAEQTVEIGILTGGLHDSAPARVTDKVRHRRKSHMNAAHGRFLRCHSRTLPGKLRIKACALSQWNRINGFEAVDHVQHEKHWDFVGLLFDLLFLKLFQRFRSHAAENGTSPGQHLRRIKFRRHWPHRCDIAGKHSRCHLVHLINFLLQRHIRKKSLEFFLCHRNTLLLFRFFHFIMMRRDVP